MIDPDMLAPAGLPAAAQTDAQASSRGGRYALAVEGYDWGAVSVMEWLAAQAKGR